MLASLDIDRQWSLVGKLMTDGPFGCATGTALSDHRAYNPSAAVTSHRGRPLGLPPIERGHPPVTALGPGGSA